MIMWPGQINIDTHFIDPRRAESYHGNIDKIRGNYEWLNLRYFQNQWQSL